MRFAPTPTAALLAFFMLAPPAMAFDVQNGGGQAGGSANLAPEASAVPGVSLDQDLRAQLGLADDRKATAAAKSGLQFGGGCLRRWRGPDEPDLDGLRREPLGGPAAASRLQLSFPSNR